MAEKKKRGEYSLSHEELASQEMVFIALTMLEGRGYPGFMELMSVIKDPSLLLQLIRLFYGMTIKFPPLNEFIKCLRAAEYAFCDTQKKVNDKLVVKPNDIRNHMGISEQEEAELLEIFDEWCKFMHDNGHDVRNYLHLNRENTRRRIEMTCKGKKWTAAKY